MIDDGNPEQGIVLLTREQLLRKLQWSGPTLYRRVRSGEFPAPIDTGGNLKRWFEHEVNQYLMSRPRVGQPSADDSSDR